MTEFDKYDIKIIYIFGISKTQVDLFSELKNNENWARIKYVYTFSSILFYYSPANIWSKMWLNLSIF